ncbi:MAG: hypothetical protein HZA54_09470 [Planctomycetes bacterium]|nr:hypothetical protein [Planctomycetota bacterium]
MKRRLAGWLAAATILGGLAGAAWADGKEAEDLFYRGWYAETSDRDLAKALGYYQQVLDRYAAEEATAAKAQYAAGYCLERLGRSAEAQAAYRAVVDRFRGSADLVAKAQARLTALAGDGSAPLPTNPPAEGAVPASARPPAADGARATTDPGTLAAALGAEAGPVRDAAFVEAAHRDSAALGAVRDAVAALPAGNRERAQLALAALDHGAVDGAGLLLWSQLVKVTVDLHFNEAPLGDVLEFLREFSGLNLIVDGARIDLAAGEPVSCVLKGVSMASALKLVGAGSWVPCVHEGVILLTTPDGKVALAGQAARRAEAGRARAAELNVPAAEAELRRKLVGTKVTVDFTDASLADILSFLQDLTGLNVVSQSSGGHALAAEGKLTIRARDLSVEHLLGVLCDTAGLEYTTQDGIILVRGTR